MQFQRLTTPLLNLLVLLAQAGQHPAANMSPFTEKVVIAVVSAVLSLLGGYILLQLKEKREAHKQLSYDLAVRNVLDVDDVIAKDIAVTYKNRPAGQISFVTCDVKNTGNRVIKDQSLRFAFGKSATVIDAYLDPPPPLEFGVAEVADDKLLDSERKFAIKHLERDQAVGLRFVVAGTIEGDVKIHPFNEGGDVEVLPGTVSKSRDDRVSFERFIVFFILGSIIPPIFYRLPSEIGDMAASLVYITIAIALLPSLRPTSRLIASSIAGLARVAIMPTLQIDELHQAPSAEMTIAVGTSASVTRTAPTPSEPPPEA